MRILWLSNAPHAPSGYGRQTRIWAKKLRELGHDVAVVAFHGLQSSVLVHEGTVVYPGGDDQWAQDILPGHYQHHRADLLITLMDAWVLDGQRLKRGGMRFAHWMPVDCDPLGTMDTRVLDEGEGQPIAMSRFGERVLSEAGYSPLYVPHGIDAQGTFEPLKDREEWRKKLGFSSRFVIGVHGANMDPLRKGFAEMFAAFALFRKKHPDALLVVHSRPRSAQGTDLVTLAQRLGITDAVKIGDEYSIVAGIVPDTEIARWLGVCDVLMNCSYGEGFGLAVLEAQACGTPVITTDFSAMSELTGAGWKVQVDPTELFWNRGHSSWWARPSVRRIAACLEKAYAQAPGLRQKARDFALGYDADRVLTEFWKPALESLEDAR